MPVISSTGLTRRVRVPSGPPTTKASYEAFVVLKQITLVMYYTYIILSKSHNLYYKGFTTEPQKRLWEHNNNLSRYTAGKGPWSLVYVKEHRSKHEALIEEKRIKRLKDRSIQNLINSPENIALSFV